MESENAPNPAPASTSAVDGDGASHPVDHDVPAPARPSARSTWTFRIVGAIALLVAIWFGVYALGRSSNQAEAPADDPAIVQQVPLPGSHVLQQSQVGALLQTGYDGRLTIDGTAIPEGQMDGAVDPGSANYDPRYGVRPNNRNQVFFTPGPGKVITRYNNGEVTITVELWQIVRGRSHSRKVTWSVFVT